jgi:hypothetical protein
MRFREVDAIATHQDRSHRQNERAALAGYGRALARRQSMHAADIE